MAKDYAKLVPPKLQRSSYKSWRIALGFIFILVVLGFAAVSYISYSKKSPQAFISNPKIVAFLERIATRVHPQETLGSPQVVSNITAKKDLPPPVQFDFYNELPTMQVSPSVMTDAKPNVLSTPKLPVIVNPPLLAAKASASSIPQKNIINPDEITTILAAEVNSSVQYMLQLGAYDTEYAAKLMLSALSAVGFKAKIVKLNKNGHIIYEVQQGPFRNLALAKSSQQRLQKRGIISVIHKSM